VPGDTFSDITDNIVHMIKKFDLEEDGYCDWM
jgi:hypothetical protein